jgi:hypothetical protein
MNPHDTNANVHVGTWTKNSNQWIWNWTTSSTFYGDPWDFQAQLVQLLNTEVRVPGVASLTPEPVQKGPINRPTRPPPGGRGPR